MGGTRRWSAPDEVDGWIGLDVGKDEHYADVLDDDGQPLFGRAVGNDEAALVALLDRAGEHGIPGLVIDQPGSIAQLAIAVAARCGVPVAQVPGLVMRRAADLYPCEAKTDRRDAFVLAYTGRTRRHQVHWLDVGSDELLDALRVLNGFDIDLAANVVRLTNRLRDALTTGRARIKAKIKRRSPRMADRIADAISTALDGQTLTLPAQATLGRVIGELAVELDRVHARRDALAAEIEEAFLAHPFGQLLVTMPGIGPRTGARILAEIGDCSRFADGARLASYAGLAPVTRQSGTSLKGESRSRRGNHRLKNAMFLAAFASLRHPDSKAFYDRKRAEGKKHNAALICLARRRCNVILAMLRTHTPYNPATPEPAASEAA